MKKKYLAATLGSMTMTLALMLSVSMLSGPRNVQAAIATDPNAETEGFRQIRTKKFTVKQRAYLRRLRREANSEHAAAPTSYSVEDFRNQPRIGTAEVVKEKSDVTIPSRCTRLKGARAIRCAAVYLKDGLVYDSYKVYGRTAVKPEQDNKEKPRVSVTKLTPRPGARTRVTQKIRYVPVLEKEPLIPPSDLLFETLTVTPRHASAPTEGPMRPIDSQGSTTEQ